MAGFVFRTLASSTQNGALVQSLSLGQAATLAADFTVNYPAFLTTAQSLINTDVQAVEAGEAEGTRNQLTISGWGGQAGNAASALNSEWHAGKLRGTDGTTLAAWPDPGYSTQIAWASADGNTLTLRWVKWEWQLYLVIFVLIAVVGYLVYRVLTSGGWALQSAIPQTGSSPGLGGAPSPGGLFGSTPFIGTSPGGGPFRVAYLPWYDFGALLLGGVGIPWGYRQYVRIQDSRAQAVRDETAIRRLEGEG